MILPYYRTPYRLGSRSWLTENTFSLNNFGGGMNNVDADNTIADNECSNCMNMMFISNALMQKRYGTEYVDNTRYPSLSSPVTWCDEYKPTLSESSFIRATSTAVYVENKKICDVEGDIRGVNYVGKYYFVDGKSLRVYDGTKVYKIIAEPVGYLSGDLSSGFTTMKFEKIPEQLKVGDTAYFLSSVISAEADVQKKVTAINTETKTVTIDSAVNYAIKKGNPIFFYIPLALKYNEGEQVYDDEKGVAYYKPCLKQLADTYTGAGYIPSNPSVITVHKDRLFIAGDEKQPHSVFLSWVTQPLWFPSNSHVSANPDGSKIVDLVVFDDALIIGRHEDIYVLYGNSVYDTSSNPFKLKQMDVSTGFMCAGCGALLNNYYIFLGYDGRFYKLNTPTTFVEYLMTKPLPRKIDLYSEPFNFPISSKLNLSTVAYRNEIYFSVRSINEDGTFGTNFIFVYSYDNMAWTYFSGFDSTSLYSDGLTLFAGTWDGCFIKYANQENNANANFNDLGKAISAVYHTKRYDLSNPIGFKYFKSLMLTSHAFDDINSTINIDIEIDYYTNSAPIEFYSNIPRYGKAEWGVDSFNNKNLYKTGWINLDIKGRTIKFLIKNDKKGETMKIYDLNVLFTNRDVR